MRRTVALVAAAIALAACRGERAPRPTARTVMATKSPALRGIARDLDGRLLVGATIRAEPVAPFEGCPDARVAAETTVASDGTYAFPNLYPGDWALSCSIDGALHAPAGIIESPAVAEFDVHLPVGPLVEGTVVDDATGAPVAGATVRIVDLSHSVAGAPTTDARGRFSASLHRDDVSLWEFLLDAGGYACDPVGADSGRDVAACEGARIDVALRARRGGTLRGVVVGPDGPVAGATVTAWPFGVHTDTIPLRRTTDAAGRYEFANLEEGEAAVFVRASLLTQKETRSLDYLRADAPDSLFAWHCPDECRARIAANGETRHDVTLEPLSIRRACSVEGRVLTEDGAPIAGATVRWPYGDDPIKTTSAADGSFRLGIVPFEDGVVQLVADAVGFEGFAPCAPVSVAGVASDVEIRLSRLPRVRGRVAFADGRPAAGATVVVVASFVGACDNALGGPSGPRFTSYVTRAGEDGTYEIAYRRRGALRVRAEVAGLPPADFERAADEGDADVVADLTTAARRALVGRAVRRGTSDGAGGVPVAVVPQRWDDETWPTNDAIRSAVVRAVTRADGSFRIAECPAGRWMLLVGGGAWTSETVAADASSATPPVVEVESALSLRGTVRFADGRPVLAARVEVWPKDPDACVGTDSIGSRLSTDVDGAFVARGLGAAQIWVTARIDEPEILIATAGPIDPGTRAVELRLAPLEPRARR